MSAAELDDLAARALSTAFADPLDAAVGAACTHKGATSVVTAIVGGRSSLRRASAYAARFAAIAEGRSPASLARDLLDRARDVGARFVVPGSAEWPVRVDDLGVRRPFGLWARGPLVLDQVASTTAIAIVGARAATGYGESVAVEFAADLAGRGWVVVSGGAYGIDASAHRGALAVNGRTIAVLANGIDLTYPRGNDALLARVGDHGAIVTELAPGATPTRAGFLCRNRIIAALADVTLVVEASLRSGSASTVARAVELGRDVCGTPGPVTSAMSVGVHALLRDGATLVAEPAHVVELMGRLGEVCEVVEGASRPGDSLGPDDRAFLDVLHASRAMALDVAAARAGLDPSRAHALLGRLEIDGWVERTASGVRLTDRGRTR